MATSELTHRVTGVSGVGMSYGLYKPDNTVGCCGKPHHEEEVPCTKTICSIRISVGGMVKVNSSQSSKIKTCN